MPLPVLVRHDGRRGAARSASRPPQGLRHVSVRCVNIGVGRENLTEKHWIYYPEDTVFHRIFVQGNASPHCNPPGGFGLTCEITYSPHKPLPCDGDALIQRCIDDCHKVGIFRPEDPVWAADPGRHAVCLCGLRPRARRRTSQAIRDWLAAARHPAGGPLQRVGVSTTPTTLSSRASRPPKRCALCKTNLSLRSQRKYR